MAETKEIEGLFPIILPNQTFFPNWDKCSLQAQSIVGGEALKEYCLERGQKGCNRLYICYLSDLGGKL